MSPADGANMWQTYINPLQYKGYKLISPACTNSQTGLDWYQQFFAACSGCHVRVLYVFLGPVLIMITPVRRDRFPRLHHRCPSRH